MDTPRDDSLAQPEAMETELPEAIARRELVRKLAKAAIIPAIVTGITAANVDPAKATYIT